MRSLASAESAASCSVLLEVVDCELYQSEVHPALGVETPRFAYESAILQQSFRFRGGEGRPDFWQLYGELVVISRRGQEPQALWGNSTQSGQHCWNISINAGTTKFAAEGNPDRDLQGMRCYYVNSGAKQGPLASGIAAMPVVMHGAMGKPNSCSYCEFGTGPEPLPAARPLPD